MTPQEHIAAALDFLALADQPVARQRPLLQSELFWCAAAHAVKATFQLRYGHQPWGLAGRYGNTQAVSQALRAQMAATQ